MNIARIGLTCLLAISSPLLAAAEEIIVDNKDAVTHGAWDKSTGSAQKFQTDYIVSSSTDASAPTSSAKFVPNIQTAGRYDVDVWFTSGENRSDKAPVTITGKSGTVVYPVNEKKNGGKWVNVAKGIEFDAGTTGSVTIGNNTGAMGSMVVADAVRLTLASGDGGYSLTLTASQGGTFAKDPNKSSFEPGSSVFVTAVPDEGYVFNGWTGDATGAANPLNVTMDKDKSIGATFVQGGVGVIVEAEEAEFDGGDWQKGEMKFGKPHGQNFKWISGGKSKGKKATATYTPNIPRSGLYDIYVWYVPGGNRSATAPYEILCKDGESVAKVNQQSGGNDWVLLASAKPFDAGKSGYVRLNNIVEEASAVVVADAVAFVYVGGLSGSQTAKR